MSITFFHVKKKKKNVEEPPQLSENHWCKDMKFETLKHTIYWVYLAQMVKYLPTMWETRVRSLGWEDLLETEMTTHSSTLAWKIQRTEEPGGLQSMGSQRVGHDWATSLTFTMSGNFLHFLLVSIHLILTTTLCNKSSFVSQILQMRKSQLQ